MKKILAIIYLILIFLWLFVVAALAFDIKFTDVDVYFFMYKVVVCLICLVGIGLAINVYNNGEFPIISILTAFIFAMGIVLKFIDIDNSFIVSFVEFLEYLSFLILIIFSVQSRSNFHFKYKIALAFNTIILLVYLVLVKNETLDLSLLQDQTVSNFWVFFTIACFLANPAIACITDNNISGKNGDIMNVIKKPGSLVLSDQVEQEIADKHESKTIKSVFDRKPEEKKETEKENTETKKQGV